MWFRELLSGCVLFFVSVLGFAAASPYLVLLGVCLPLLSPAADDHVQQGQLVQDQALHPLSLLSPYEPEKEMDLHKLARMPGIVGRSYRPVSGF